MHERPHYFRKVVEALERSEGIGSVYGVVVSLDSAHPDIIDIVRLSLSLSLSFSLSFSLSISLSHSLLHA